MKTAADATPIADYALAAMLSPYVRGALEHWREPWHIPRRVVLDYLLVYIVSGTGPFSVGDDRFDVGPGDLIWIPPGVLHEMRGVSPTMFVAYLHFDLVHDVERSPRVRSGARYPQGPHPDMHPVWARQPIAGWSAQGGCMSGWDPCGYRAPLRTRGLRSASCSRSKCR